MSLREDLQKLNREMWTDGSVSIRPVETEEDLVYAVFECRLTEEQQELVNPAGFSIGRAYIRREDNYPCLICDGRDEPVGFICFTKWLGEGEAYSWSFFIDRDHQGRGYGRRAAQLSVRILKAADPEIPVKLAAEKDNERARRLYESLGFSLLPELDGDDLVYGLRS